MLIATVGLFGVMSFLVTQRTREIGVRMALGATPACIVRMMLASAGRWTAVGILLMPLGLAGHVARVLRSLLFQAELLHDPMVIAAAAAVLGAVALGAAAGPARRAARLDPNRTLRQE